VGVKGGCGYQGWLWVSRVAVGVKGGCGYQGWLWVSRVAVGIKGGCGYQGWLWVSRVAVVPSTPPLEGLIWDISDWQNLLPTGSGHVIPAC